MRRYIYGVLMIFTVVAALAVAPHAVLACNDGADGNGVHVSGALGIAGSGGGEKDCVGGTVGGKYTNPIFALISYAIQYASAVLGLVLILMVVIAGLQYVLSGTSPDAAKDAKDRLQNAFTGFVMFILMWGIIQIILPVGVFKN